MLIAFLAAIMPVIIIAGVGAVLSRFTQYLENPSLPQLVVNVSLPCLLLYSMLGMHLDIIGMSKLVLGAFMTLAGMMLITLIMLKLTGLSIRYYLPVLVNPNTGNLGIPIAYALLGEKGMAGAVIISAIIEISHFTVGVGMMSGSFSPRRLLANPPVIALIIGGLVLGLDMPVPHFVLVVLEMLGNVAVPVMLLMLGRSLSHMKVREAPWGRLALLSLYRPGIGLAMGYLVAWALNLSWLMTANLMIACSMPVAVLNYIFVTRYRGPVNEVAGLTFLTSPTAFVALVIIRLFIIQ